MKRSELAKEMTRVAHLKGDFLLRSGQRSDFYFDKYRFESDPRLLRAIAQEMAPYIPKDIEYLAGLELGGVPIATALSLETGIPAIFVRKEAKTYGTCRLAEGADFEGKKIVVIEDVVTTGGQVVASCQELQKAGAQIVEAHCVIYRGKYNQPKIDNLDLPLHALFTQKDLID